MVRIFYRDSLWSLIAGPTIWAAHFLLCYIAAAIFCAKVADSAGSFDRLRLFIVVATAIALAGIVYVGAQAVDNWRRALNADWAADANSLEIRRHFIGRATFLLAGLSAIAVIYVGLVAIFISSCQ